MKKLLFGTLFLGLSTMTFARGTRHGYGDKPVYSMPEPGGIIELGACAVGLTVWARRSR